MDINDIIQIFTEKIGNAEKENVLLQAKAIYMQRENEELNNEIKELKNEILQLKNETDEVIEEK